MRAMGFWAWSILLLGTNAETYEKHFEKPQQQPQMVLGEVLLSSSRVPVKRLGEVFGTTDNVFDFVAEHKDTLLSWTRQEQAQVCGVVCSKISSLAQGQYGMVITTVGSQLQCPVIPQCPSGMVETSFHVRTHVDAERVVPNAVDQLYGISENTPQEPNMFSLHELGGKNMFLVAPRIVLFHDGTKLVVVKPKATPPHFLP